MKIIIILLIIFLTGCGQPMGGIPDVAIKVVDLLENKTAIEKATIKGEEIAKIKKIKKTKREKYDIEIVDMKAIESGVELFVRAWDKDGQIGFVDGTVDIERFVFINPPILVDDPKGDIIREWTDSNGVFYTRKLREDLLEAILQDLEHTISIKTQIFNSDNIVAGKIGNTTSVFRSAAGANSPVDGWLQNDNNGGTWTATRDGSSGSIGGGDTATASELGANNSRPQIDFSYFLFDISAISTDDNIDSATISLWHTAKVDGAEAESYITIVKSCLASNSAIATSDFNHLEDTSSSCAFGSGVALKKYSNDIDIGSITTGQFQEYTLNSNAITLIETAQDGDGIVKLGASEGHVIEDTPPSGDNRANHYLADETGTTNDPKFVVEHSAAPTDTCTYGGTGNWDVLESDNCYITSDVYVNGSFNLIGSSTSAIFGCADDIKVSAENFNFGTDKTSFDLKCFAHH